MKQMSQLNTQRNHDTIANYIGIENWFTTVHFMRSLVHQLNQHTQLVGSTIEDDCFFSYLNVSMQSVVSDALPATHPSHPLQICRIKHCCKWTNTNVNLNALKGSSYNRKTPSRCMQIDRVTPAITVEQLQSAGQPSKAKIAVRRHVLDVCVTVTIKPMKRCHFEVNLLAAEMVSQQRTAALSSTIIWYRILYAWLCVYPSKSSAGMVDVAERNCAARETRQTKYV